MEAILFASIFTGVVAGLRWKFKKWKFNLSELAQIPKLDADLWKIFSKYIRSKDADWKGYVNCFTCDRPDNWKSLDAGHYIPKATSGSYLKFYEKNVNPQCITCNRINGGNYKVYKDRLILKYGQGIIEELNALRQSAPLTVPDYQTKIRYYANQLKIINSK